MRADLLSLAGQVEVAPVPDRELDEAIAKALGWTPIPNPDFAGGLVGRWYQPDGEMSGMEGPPRWTTSLDAAKTLWPERWYIRVTQVRFGLWRVEGWLGDKSVATPCDVESIAPSEERARTAASLRAIASQEAQR